MAADETPFVVDTYEWLYATSKIFLTPPIFPSEELKKKRSRPTATHIMDHHHTFLQLLELLCAPSSTVTVRQRLFKLTEEHDLPLPLSATIAKICRERGAINLDAEVKHP